MQPRQKARKPMLNRHSVFEALADCEQTCSYAKKHNPGDAAIEAAAAAVRAALVAFAEATGERNE